MYLIMENVFKDTGHMVTSSTHADCPVLVTVDNTSHVVISTFSVFQLQVSSRHNLHRLRMRSRVRLRRQRELQRDVTRRFEAEEREREEARRLRRRARRAAAARAQKAREAAVRASDERRQKARQARIEEALRTNPFFDSDDEREEASRPEFDELHRRLRATPAAATIRFDSSASISLDSADGEEEEEAEGGGSGGGAARSASVRSAPRIESAERRTRRERRKLALASRWNAEDFSRTLLPFDEEGEDDEAGEENDASVGGRVARLFGGRRWGSGSGSRDSRSRGSQSREGRSRDSRSRDSRSRGSQSRDSPSGTAGGSGERATVLRLWSRRSQVGASSSQEVSAGAASPVVEERRAAAHRDGRRGLRSRLARPSGWLRPVGGRRQLDGSRDASDAGDNPCKGDSDGDAASSGEAVDERTAAMEEGKVGHVDGRPSISGETQSAPRSGLPSSQDASSDASSDSSAFSSDDSTLNDFHISSPLEEGIATTEKNDHLFILCVSPR